MTLFAIQRRDDLLAVRFACSPAWETLAAVRTFVDERSRAYHEPWHRLVQERRAQLDLGALLATQPLRGFVPDFLTPPPPVPWPRLRDQLAEIRATPPGQVAHELELCRATVERRHERRVLDQLLADPQAARDTLAAQIHDAWRELVAPFWIRLRTLLGRRSKSARARSPTTGCAASSMSSTRESNGPSAASRSPIATTRWRAWGSGDWC